jgi:adenylate kinase family enzyme
MERIAIVGCGGSGKTHLARQLAQQLDLPLTHLDAVYYDENWETLPKEEFAMLQKGLVAEPRWIIEGNYAGTLPVRLEAADAVIVMDLPARTCLLGILQRRLRHRGGQHKATGVYDRINWSFIRYVIGYRKSMLPRVHQLIAEHAPTAQIVVLQNRRAAQQFLDGASRTTT